MKRPDEMTSFEYLKEHLYDAVINGLYEREFREVKKLVFEMKTFSSFTQFLKKIGKRKNIKIKEEAVISLIRIYQCRKELRPSIGVVLVMVLWKRLVRIAPGEWFDDAYYQLFIQAETFDTDEPNIIERDIIGRLMECIRKEIRAQKCAGGAIEETDDYAEITEENEQEESEAETRNDLNRFISFCDEWWKEYARNGDEETEAADTE